VRSLLDILAQPPPVFAAAAPAVVVVTIVAAVDALEASKPAAAATIPT
jgi:hypothetical protein